MVRMVAMTASLAMSLPSRRHRGAHKIRGERELKREQDPSGKFEPDLAATHLVGRARQHRADQPGQRLQGSEGDDEHRAGLDGERD
jgi:hypothetical protein